jgi:AraC family transcriptional regulator
MVSIDSSLVLQAASEDMEHAIEGYLSPRCEEDSVNPQRRMRGRLTQLQIRGLHEYIESHLGDVIQTRHLSEVVNLSRFHFCRVFRLSVGASPRKYLLQLRLQRAKVLLQESSSSVSEIAHLCGFVDQSHLTRMFRRRIGTTPARWRQQSCSERSE